LRPFNPPIARRADETDIRWFHRLGWKLLEYKCAYYRPEAVKEQLWVERELCISDAAYDALEAEYKTLAITLKQTDSISGMVDFDLRKPSCQLILTKLSGG
jgi:hypothetical protein